MNILGIFLNNEIRTGGHIRALELFEGLAARGNKVTVLLNNDLKYLPDRFSALCIEAKYKRKRIPPASKVFEKAVIQLLDTQELKDSYDILLVFGETHLNAARVVNKRLDIPVVFAYQSNTVLDHIISLKEHLFKIHLLPWKLIAIFRYMHKERTVSKICAGIVFQSTFDRNDFVSRNKNANNKVFVIGGNIGGSRFPESEYHVNQSSQCRKILFMGTLGERKGLIYLCNALHELDKNGFHDIELHIAGPGTKPEQLIFQRYFRRRNLSSRVFFYGRVPDVFPLMKTCDILVVPSRFDSYPDIVLLGLHAGIPVIGSRIGGIPDMLSHHELLFSPQNSDAIVKILLHCLKDSEYYMRIRELCNSRYSSFLFDWPAAWEEHIKRILYA